MFTILKYFYKPLTETYFTILQNHYSFLRVLCSNVILWKDSV